MNCTSKQSADFLKDFINIATWSPPELGRFQERHWFPPLWISSPLSVEDLRVLEHFPSAGRENLTEEELNHFAQTPLGNLPEPLLVDVLTRLGSIWRYVLAHPETWGEIGPVENQSGSLTSVLHGHFLNATKDQGGALRITSDSQVVSIENSKWTPFDAPDDRKPREAMQRVLAAAAAATVKVEPALIAELESYVRPDGFFRLEKYEARFLGALEKITAAADLGPNFLAGKKHKGAQAEKAKNQQRCPELQKILERLAERLKWQWSAAELWPELVVAMENQGLKPTQAGNRNQLATCQVKYLPKGSKTGKRKTLKFGTFKNIISELRK